MQHLRLIIFLIFFLHPQILCQESTQPLIADREYPPETASQLENRAAEAAARWNRQAVEHAVQIYLEAAEIYRQTNRKDKLSECFRKLAKLKIILGEKPAAELYLNQAVKILDGRQMPAEKSLVLSDLANLAIAEGENAKCEKYFSESRRLAEKSADATALGAVYYSIAEFYYLKSDLSKPLDFYRKSVEFWQQTGDVKGEALSLLKLGILYFDSNDYAAALTTLNSALHKSEQIGDLRGQAFALKALGTLYNVTNEKQTAVEFYKKSESLMPPDLDFFDQASLSNSFGSIYEYYSDFQTSAEYRRKGLDFFRRDHHKYGQLATLTSLFRLNSLMNNDEAALDYFKQAESLARQLNNNFYLALNETQIGTFHFNRRQFQEAEKRYRNCLKLLQSNRDTRQISLVSAKLGKIYEQKKDWQTAYKFYADSLQMNQKVKDNFAEADTLYNLASVENLLGKPNALSLAARSVHLTETSYSDVDNSKLKKSYFSSVFDRYELYINLLMKKHAAAPDEGYAVQALQAAEKSRARSMLENLALDEAAFSRDAPPATVKREKEIHMLLNSKADKLTDLLSGQSDPTEIAQLDREMSALEHELEIIKATLKQSSPIYSAIKNPAPFNIAEFQRDVLDADSLLLEFSFGTEASYLWVADQTTVSSYVLPPRQQIESRIEKLRHLLAQREINQNESIENYQTRISEAESIFDYEAKQLSDQLFGQIADKLSRKRLLIVPDGKLQYFPVAALPLPHSTDSAPILLINETVYEPSAATLALLMKTGRKSSAAPKNLLVFSDPIFSVQDPRIKPVEIVNETGAAVLPTEKLRFAESLNSLMRLNATRDEADAIIQIVGDFRSTSFSGAAATRERALETSTSDYKIIHFATHGLVYEARPELSGIVLSQIDENGQSRNGVVRLQDIYGLNLTADAVVLSACDTGLGKEVKGEGLASLNNAFLQTGAKSVVSSLWKVDDYATRDLMKYFYSELTSGTVTTAAALRRAQIKLRENPQYQSPFYWAAFTLQGDFQTTPQFAATYEARIYGWLILPLTLLAVYAFRRRHNYRTAKP